MSKHGGSPESGLVLPIGLEALRPETPEGMVLVPQEVIDSRKQAEERKERGLQLERRRVALEVLRASPPMVSAAGGGMTLEAYLALTATCDIATAAVGRPTTRVDLALKEADELIAKTGGGI